MSTYTPEHTQVNAWDPVSGNYAVVDEGMADILKGLWTLGIRTQYSCQGGEYLAYVLMDRRSGKLFEKLMRDMFPYLSPEAREMADIFLQIQRSHKFIWDWKDKDGYHHSRSFTFGRKTIHERLDSFYVERTYQRNPHKLRSTYRWPVKFGPAMLQLVTELNS